MGNLKAAFNSLLYAIAILSFLLFTGMLFGITSWFGDLFSFPGLVVAFFLIFTTIAK